MALLVEDEFLVGLDIAEQLNGLGFRVVGPAGRVADAIRLAEGAGNVAVGVLDINLAGDLSWPVARALQERGVPFIFVTGYLEIHAAVPQDLAGSIICPKPLEAEHLRNALEKALRETGKEHG